MLKKLFFLLVSCAMLSPNLVQAQVTPEALTDPGKTIMVKTDQKDITIKLKSNRTTGYSWFLTSYDHQLLRLDSYQYIAPNTKLVGAPGVEEWHFNVSDAAKKAPQASKIILVYARPWEIQNAKETVIRWVSM